MSKKLTSICISDIHLGSTATPTEFIIENLNTCLPDNDTMANVDIIYLAGDVFDQILYFNDGSVNAIQLWMVRLLRLCSKWDITLRILEGTPSHDRGQSKHFIEEAKRARIDVDVKYIDTILIEYIEKHDIHVLYIPDEYHSTTEETWQAVLDLMELHGLSKVDYAVMHGMFEHQIPAGLRLQHHKAENYLSIVRKYIFIGHVHQMSVYERILAQGSFDRLCHGDEEEKGFWKVTAFNDSQDDDRIQFVINQNAAIFKTINWINKEESDIRVEMQQIEDFRPGSAVRVQMLRDAALEGLYNSYKQMYPRLVWKTDIVKDSNTHDVSVKLVTYQPTPINQNTIQSLVAQKLQLLGVEQNKQEYVMELLASVK